MSLLSQLRTLRKQISNEVVQVATTHVEVNGFQVRLNRNDGTWLDYIPEPTALLYHADNSRVKHQMGPYSSGKSVTSIMDCFLDAINIAPCKDGIRRCRTVMMRTTYNELQSTTIKTFLAWFNDFGYPPPGRSKTYVKMPYPTFHVRFNDGRGIVDWEVMFMAFESEGDVKKLGSLEVTNGFINETRDFPKAVFDAATGRIGRFPRVDDLNGQEYYASIKSDTNPPTDRHWLYELLEVNKPDTYRIFKQPPAVIKDGEGKWIENPLADNLKHNSKHYYLHMIQGKSLEYIKVFARGEYGLAFDGKRVFEEYNDDIHAVDHIDFVRHSPLYLGWDFGLTPCLVVAQYVMGQFRIIQEFVTENFGIENLIEERVKPFWQLHGLNDYEIASSDADPAGKARSSRNIEEPCLIEVITNSFVDTREAISNKEGIRLEAVRSFFNRNVKGQPSIIISKSGCPILREGFNGQYYLKKVTIAGKGEGMYTSSPEKTHPHSEPQDCVQYIALRLASNGPYDNNANRPRVHGRVVKIY